MKRKYNFKLLTLFVVMIFLISLILFVGKYFQARNEFVEIFAIGHIMREDFDVELEVNKYIKIFEYENIEYKIDYYSHINIYGNEVVLTAFYFKEADRERVEKIRLNMN